MDATNPNLDLRAENLGDGRWKYTLPLGRRIDQQIEYSDGIFGREGRLVGQGDIMRLAKALFPDNLNTRLFFGAVTNFGQMAVLKAYPYQAGDGCMLYPVEIWFEAPDPARETIGGERRTEITITGEGYILPHRSAFQTAHESLKGRTAGQANAPNKPQEIATESVGLQKQVFQPLLRYTAQRSVLRLHSEGDVAKLLGLLGGGVLGKATITETEGTGIQKSGAGASVDGYFCEPPHAVVYNTKISVHVQVDGRGLALGFEVPRHERSRTCPKEEWSKRQLITVSGPEEIVARITKHPDFARTCAELKTRNTAAIDIYEDNAFPTEFAVTLARPVFQPRAELDGTLKPADGDISTLFGRIFEGKATVEKSEWKTVFVKPYPKASGLSMGHYGIGRLYSSSSAPDDLFESSRWNDRLVVELDVGGRRLAVSIEVPKRKDETGVAQAELEARRVITIKGDPGLVAQVKDHPDLALICAELNQRGITAIQTKTATPAATEAEAGEKPKEEHVRLTPEQMRQRGFVRMKDDGRTRVCRDLGAEPRPPSPDQGFMEPRFPHMNLADGAKRLTLKPKERVIQGHGKPVTRPAPAKTRW